MRWFQWDGVVEFGCVAGDEDGDDKVDILVDQVGHLDCLTGCEDMQEMNIDVTT